MGARAPSRRRPLRLFGSRALRAKEGAVGLAELVGDARTQLLQRLFDAVDDLDDLLAFHVAQARALRVHVPLVVREAHHVLILLFELLALAQTLVKLAVVSLQILVVEARRAGQVHPAPALFLGLAIALHARVRVRGLLRSCATVSLTRLQVGHGLGDLPRHIRDALLTPASLILQELLGELDGHALPVLALVAPERAHEFVIVVLELRVLVHSTRTRTRTPIVS